MATFNVTHCTKEELLQRCSDLMFSCENKELAVEFFIDKTRQQILADRLNVDVKSVTMRKLRMKKKLNKNT